jgi:phosphoglycerate dehydrogenase-like enzyme
LIKPRVLNLTPISQINGLTEYLSDFFEVESMPYADSPDAIPNKQEYVAIYINPNMSKLYLDKHFLQDFKNLKVIATASTGLTHIDLEYLKEVRIELLSLTTDFDFINQISSTAEHAFALTLEGLRNLKSANDSVINGKWEYLPFIGRQISNLTFGVIGYGRLGKFYAKYAHAFGASVLVYDPYIKVQQIEIVKQVSKIEDIFVNSDVVSLHVHVNSETTNLINEGTLAKAKETLLLVNTSRGEIVSDLDLIAFLEKNPKAKYSTDVLNNEARGLLNNPIFQYSLETSQIFVSPHIGGMTEDAQKIAYYRTAEKLRNYFSDWTK